LVQRKDPTWCQLAGNVAEIVQFVYLKDQLLPSTDR
jgi:hypothetical protein